MSPSCSMLGRPARENENLIKIIENSRASFYEINGPFKKIKSYFILEGAPVNYSHASACMADPARVIRPH